MGDFESGLKNLVGGLLKAKKMKADDEEVLGNMFDQLGVVFDEFGDGEGTDLAFKLAEKMMKECGFTEEQIDEFEDLCKGAEVFFNKSKENPDGD